MLKLFVINNPISFVEITRRKINMMEFVFHIIFKCSTYEATSNNSNVNQFLYVFDLFFYS